MKLKNLKKRYRLLIGLVCFFVVLPAINMTVFKVLALVSPYSPVAQYYGAIDATIEAQRIHAQQARMRGLPARQIPDDKGGEFRLVYVVTSKGSRLAEYGDLATGATANGGDGFVIPFRLSDEALQRGAIRLEAPKKYYRNEQIEGYVKKMEAQVPRNSLYLGVFGTMIGLGFVVVIGAAIWIWRGRRKRLEAIQLRGAVLAEGSQFNAGCVKQHGIGFPNNGWDAREPRVYVSRWQESSHFLIMGDSGTGKSTLIKDMLRQIQERQEAAIIYDPALEYTRMFYTPTRGDVILNPLDERMPYWSPGDEVRNEAETTALAASMFPDKPRESNTFFTEAPRKVFARLLSFKPTPEELTRWMSSESELEAKLKDSELASLISSQAGPQRVGVISSLNMVADSLKMLPRREQTERSWTAREWMQERKGWIFLTSTPEIRQRLFPLTSFWLDMLVLRSMNQGRPGVRPVWFVLDELASLQRLPQLHTAVTENRKSGNPVVLGFQGRSQLETRYGHDAEAMLSQPATKIFLRTSEPRAAEWISNMIGDMEEELPRESFTHGQKNSRTTSWQRRTTPLVMKSEIMGLNNLSGYLKMGNVTIPICFPYMQDSGPSQEGFIERAQPPLVAQPSAPAPVPEVPPVAVPVQAQRNPPAEPAPVTPSESVAMAIEPEQPGMTMAEEQRPLFD
jgi:type IV secretory pathway TraG/TraD family ATPase VirD4